MSDIVSLVKAILVCARLLGIIKGQTCEYSRLRQGKITLLFLALPRKTLSSAEFADREVSLLLVELDNGFRINLIIIQTSESAGA